METYLQSVKIITTLLSYCLAFICIKAFKDTSRQFFNVLFWALVVLGSLNLFNVVSEIASPSLFEFFDEIAFAEWSVNVLLFILIFAFKPGFGKHSKS